MKVNAETHKWSKCRKYGTMEGPTANGTYKPQPLSRLRNLHKRGKETDEGENQIKTLSSGHDKAIICTNPYQLCLTAQD